jgi:transcriptional regulator with GAF, ATPase, and Fis domain
MDWDRDLHKKVLGTKGLTEALRQNPAFIKFREENLENMQVEAISVQNESPGLPSYHYDPEWRLEKLFLNTEEGLKVAEKISSVLNQGQRSSSIKSISSQPKKNTSRKSKGQKLDWELVGGSEHIAKLRQEIIFVGQKMKKYDFTVLIEGPSGTGKELIAKGIAKENWTEKFSGH